MGPYGRPRSLTASFFGAAIAALVCPTLAFAGAPILVGAPTYAGSYYGLCCGYSSAAQFSLSNATYVSTVDIPLSAPQDLLISVQDSLLAPILIIQSTASQNLSTAPDVVSLRVNQTLPAGTYYIVVTEAVPSTSSINVPGWFLSDGTTITNAGGVTNGVWVRPPGGSWGFQTTGCAPEGISNPAGPCPTPAFDVNGVPLDKELGELNHPGKCSCGDPIDVGSGNLYETISDYSTAGPNPLSFSRFYNSMSTSATIAHAMGRNWRTSFDRFLGVSSVGGVPTSVFAERMDGQILSFTQNGSIWTTDSDIDIYLTQSGTTWTLTNRD